MSWYCEIFSGHRQFVLNIITSQQWSKYPRINKGIPWPYLWIQSSNDGFWMPCLACTDDIGVCRNNLEPRESPDYTYPGALILLTAFSMKILNIHALMQFTTWKIKAVSGMGLLCSFRGTSARGFKSKAPSRQQLGNGQVESRPSKPEWDPASRWAERSGWG